MLKDEERGREKRREALERGGNEMLKTETMKMARSASVTLTLLSVQNNHRPFIFKNVQFHKQQQHNS